MNVVVTGGTRGIGRAIVEAVLDAGANVAFCGRSQQSVDRAVGELRQRAPRAKAAGFVADVSRPDQVAAFFRAVDKELNGIDVLINNAGIGIFKSVADLSVEDWQHTIDTNLSGAFYCSREALTRFRQRGGGYIVNISSLAGKNPFAGGAAYNSSKFGLNGFSEAMMLDHRYENVRVSYVMPGSVATEFGSGAAAEWKIQPQDVAEIVMMLLKMPARTLVSRVEVRPSKPSR
ncbi:MAG TPA: SDR family oxidoreductase [Bryobacteraceae bacterium]|nr:SDR family oxidoreductase [Bryobacteraceae bacterium]